MSKFGELLKEFARAVTTDARDYAYYLSGKRGEEGRVNIQDEHDYKRRALVDYTKKLESLFSTVIGDDETEGVDDVFGIKVMTRNELRAEQRKRLGKL